MSASIEKTLDAMSKLIEEAKPVPLTNKTLMDTEELSRLIEDIRLNMPDEINQARRIAQERRDILDEAEADAKEIVDKARQRADLMIEEHQITKEAKSAAEYIFRQKKEEADAILADAKQRAEAITLKSEKWANDIKANASSYVETIIRETDETLTKSVNDIRTLRKSVKDVLARSNSTRPNFDE